METPLKFADLCLGIGRSLVPHFTHVAIIGAGFSGLLTAVHLLARPDGPAVTLIEKRDEFASGLAYGPCAPEHLLNVRAGNMSAFPDRPDHFIRWLQARQPGADGAAFASRRLYGAYLRDLLKGAAPDALASGRLGLVRDEAIDLEPVSDGFRLHLESGLVLSADQVVLAPGSSPSPVSPLLAGAGARLIPDPWRKGALDAVRPVDPVLILGAGPTMIDIALTLARAGRSAQIVALSRRGLLPHRHAGAPRPSPAGPPPCAAPLSQALRRFRTEAAAAPDWRLPFDALRPHTRAMWRSLSLREKSRFLRHLRPWWDVHRHRLAPSVADAVDALQAASLLKVVAGVLMEVRPSPAGVRLVWRQRGAGLIRRFEAAHVINCTGLGAEIARSENPLLRALFARGLVRPDPLELGVVADAQCRPLSASGSPTPGLFLVGPLNRAEFWESIAVPDLRVQVAGVAAALCETNER